VTEPRVPARWTDEQVERFVGNLLRYGVLSAALVALIGGVFYLARFGATPVHYHEFRGEPPRLTSVVGVVGGVLALDPRAVIQLGLLLLIATPIARVAFSLLAFIRQRDRTYVVITAIVLAILLYSLTGFER
jgi:uncharacterized membrane protein